MRVPVPMIFITRFKLYARTCKLISADTFGKVLQRKCVAPVALQVNLDKMLDLRRETFTA